MAFFFFFNATVKPKYKLSVFICQTYLKKMSPLSIFWIAYVDILSNRWYVLRMSAVGENSSDPARSEAQKRKECPSDLLGPRYFT